MKRQCIAFHHWGLYCCGVLNNAVPSLYSAQHKNGVVGNWIRELQITHNTQKTLQTVFLWNETKHFGEQILMAKRSSEVVIEDA